ncbi:T9SS C-terminal target domain-containing protein [Saprospira grandis]|uniref:Gliding motility-associated C-terminal domain-containing protein n=1 Tax=Saprospira grandis (strain Lewin) TaxID=984262 RepID=H6L7H0_SAPGL|nr:T9SS C-terminal target domain-containing protein [Saprospira grandis]AFC26842.1 hypothetical protein SGRA_4127 [Saprospira grandis str. Lewin]
MLGKGRLKGVFLWVGGAVFLSSCEQGTPAVRQVNTIQEQAKEELDTSLFLSIEDTALEDAPSYFKTIKKLDRPLDLVAEDDIEGFTAVFTPNGDSVNDYFRPLPYPLSPRIEIISFTIYNRWGSIVFDGDRSSSIKGWDGRVNGVLQAQDDYIYVFSYKIAGKERTKRGRFRLTY